MMPIRGFEIGENSRDPRIWDPGIAVTISVLMPPALYNARHYIFLVISYCVCHTLVVCFDEI